MAQSKPLDVDQPLPFGVPGRHHTERRLKSAPSVRFGMCPGHGDVTRQTGLVQQGEHLVWRTHDVVTWAGLRRPCNMNGQRVCEHPPRPANDGVPRVERRNPCPCQREEVAP